MNNQTVITSLALATLAFLGAGCSDNTTGETAATPQTTNLSAYLLKNEPSGAVNVAEARKSAKPGEKIIISGQIGGTVNPFV